LANSAIIFGSNGQDGYYLTKQLITLGIKVIGISRSSGDIIGNVGNYNFVSGLIKNEIPDYIFHFAANSTTKHDVLFDNNESISTGTINILEAVRNFSPDTKVFISGSAMQFKNDGNKININSEFDHSSLYSVARIHSVFVSRYYRDKYQLKVYIGYLFNHDSPLRSEDHINQKIVKTALRIKKGSNEKLEIGNLDVQKEFNFAGDIVKAIWLFINQEKINEIILSSGVVNSIKDWVKLCFEECDLNWEEHVIISKSFKSEYNILFGDSNTIRALGWEPSHDIKDLARLMLNKK
jgi:GDPmannose 4,6-dehydratase